LYHLGLLLASVSQAKEKFVKQEFTKMSETVVGRGRPKVYVGAQAKAMALLAFVWGLANAITVLTAKNGSKHAALRPAAINGPIPNISKPTLGKLRDQYHEGEEHVGRGRPSFEKQAAFEEACEKAYEKQKKAKAKAKVVKVAAAPVEPPVTPVADAA
jgi:hypothetical protein